MAQSMNTRMPTLARIVVALGDDQHIMRSISVCLVHLVLIHGSALS